MHLFKYGRLSVQHVTPQEWEFVLGLEGQAPVAAAAAGGKQQQRKGGGGQKGGGKKAGS